MIHDFISLIFPQVCLGCTQSLISEEHYLCTSCKIDLPLTYDSENSSNFLYQKFLFEPKIKSAAAYLYFHKQGITRNLLHELKYKGKRELGVTLGRWFAPSLKHLKLDAIVPVPLHRSKLKKRTYNQSERIALGISENLGVELRSDLLERIVKTETQTRKSKVERWTNMENVYSEISADLTGMSFLVVDDVVTTGATVGMLCQRLIEAGADTIHIAAIARGK